MKKITKKSNSLTTRCATRKIAEIATNVDNIASAIESGEWNMLMNKAMSKRRTILQDEK